MSLEDVFARIAANRAQRGVEPVTEPEPITEPVTETAGDEAEVVIDEAAE